MSDAYPVPAATAEVESEVKKSRFIARALPCDSREQALVHLAEARADYPDARHHCWAYQLGSPGNPVSAAMSDDGEPGGTAGKPILNVIAHRGIGDLMVIVIRYFGGIKLGAGGLVRAYGQATGLVLDTLPLQQMEPRFTSQAQVDFGVEQHLRHWLSRHDGEITAVNYGQRVAVTLTLPLQQRDQWLAFCAAQQIEHSQ